MHALKTCNCTVPVMAQGFADLLTGDRQFKRFPRVTPIFAMNGGAGAIFSRGLLKQIRVPQYEKCVLGKGPPIFAKCLGERAAGRPAGTPTARSLNNGDAAWCFQNAAREVNCW